MSMAVLSGSSTGRKHPTLPANIRSFAEPVSTDAFAAARSFLEQTGPIANIVFLLRIDRQRVVELERSFGGGYSFAHSLQASFADKIRYVSHQWAEIVGTDSVWKGLLAFPNVHAVGVRGTSRSINQLLSRLSGAESPVCGIVLPFPVAIPERALHWEELPADDRQKINALEQLAGRVYSLRDGFAIERELELQLLVPEIAAALNWLGEFGRNVLHRLTSRSTIQAEKLIRCLAQGSDFIHNLGIGDLRHFGDNAGRGQKVCIIDSGADESSPWLRRKVLGYRRFDRQGQEKEAYACMDSGCHGTKMGTLIAGNTVRFGDLGLTDEKVRGLTGKSWVQLRQSEILQPDDESLVRISMAPGAALFVTSVLSGEIHAETSDGSNVVAGFDFAASNELAGAKIVNVSIEAIRGQVDPHSLAGIDQVVQLMTSRGMVVITAAGNNGPESQPICKSAVVVGAADRTGAYWPKSGIDFNFRAPGVDIPCGQPALRALQGMSVDLYSGTSIAAAMASGAVAVLGSHFGVEPQFATIALQATADPATKMICLNRASEWIEQRR